MSVSISGGSPEPLKPVGSKPINPAFMAELSGVLAKNTKKLEGKTNNPNEALQDVKAHNPEFLHADQVFIDGAAKGNENSIKRTTTTFAAIQTGLARLPGRAARKARAFRAMAGQGLSNLFSKKVTNSPEASQKTSILASLHLPKFGGKKKISVPAAIAIPTPPSLEQKEAKKEQLLIPSDVVNRFHKDGLINKDQREELKALLAHKDYPETHTILLSWINNNSAPVKPGNLELQDYPALLLEERIGSFEKQVSFGDRIANDSSIPQAWKSTLAHKAKDYEHARYLANDFDAEMEAQFASAGKDSSRLPKTATAASYEDAVNTALKIYQEYAKAMGVNIEENPSLKLAKDESPRAQLSALEAVIHDNLAAKRDKIGETLQILLDNLEE